MERLQEMATWESNGHVTEYVAWPWNVKVFTTMFLEANISKTARDTGFVPADYQYVGNGLYRVEWSRARWRHVSSLLIRNSMRSSRHFQNR